MEAWQRLTSLWFALPLATASAQPAPAPAPAPDTELAARPAPTKPCSHCAHRDDHHADFAEIPLLHTSALFIVMRTSEALLWPEPFADLRPRSLWLHYRATFSEPPLFDPHTRAFEWDHDRWTINVLGHGLLGSELYYRPRRCGASPLEALAFAASASTAWEYLIEGSGVRPSALDLVYTPLSGLVFGEARYLGWNLAGGISLRPLRALVRGVLDPLGELERSLGSGC